MRGKIVSPALITANAKLRDSLRSADASPFIAHHFLPDELRDEALIEAREFVQSDVRRISKLITMFPAFGTLNSP